MAVLNYIKMELFLSLLNNTVLELKSDQGAVKTLYVLDTDLNRLPLDTKSAVDGSDLFKIAIIRSCNLIPYTPKK